MGKNAVVFSDYFLAAVWNMSCEAEYRLEVPCEALSIIRGHVVCRRWGCYERHELADHRALFWMARNNLDLDSSRVASMNNFEKYCQEHWASPRFMVTWGSFPLTQLKVASKLMARASTSRVLHMRKPKNSSRLIPLFNGRLTQGGIHPGKASATLSYQLRREGDSGNVSDKLCYNSKLWMNLSLQIRSNFELLVGARTRSVGFLSPVGSLPGQACVLYCPKRPLKGGACNAARSGSMATDDPNCLGTPYVNNLKVAAATKQYAKMFCVFISSSASVKNLNFSGVGSEANFTGDPVTGTTLLAEFNDSRWRITSSLKTYEGMGTTTVYSLGKDVGTPHSRTIDY
ncbi:hypothetical protein BU15DRAFT_68719 [Melanogaster broomeanus]|nr:hypothetical protein BU15DRAFT_68719 [Melanogaster broomeanus]